MNVFFLEAIVMNYSLIDNVGGRHGRLSKVLIFFSLMLFLSAFDFKTTTGGDKTLVIILGVTITLSGLMSAFSFRAWSTKSLGLFLSALAFLVVSAGVGFFRGQDAFSVMSMVIPLILFLVSIVILSSLKADFYQVRWVIATVTFFLLLSVIFKLIFGFYYYDQQLANVRYQIISPSIILMFAYAITSLLYKRKRLGYVCLILSILVVFISVTRSYILVYFVMCLFLVSCFSFKHWIRYFPVVIKVFGLCFLILLVSYIVFPDVFNRWVVRVFTSVADQGVDVTAVTRLAEVHYQLNKLFYNLISENKFEFKLWN